ncbi:hypothetical protein [Butyrivibrio sp. AE2032]|uniref:hypothetical protein n=1 Tax=Butyrivibrio sp. AE2032 TaxID=1458463 RepID=UPI0005599B78|nr:hypothetical protein [Butyrivibrio sp. AE2032]
MGLFDLLKNVTRDEDWEKQTKLQNWNDIVYTRKDVDMDDPVQRREYINSCLAQMQEASDALNALEDEYNDVTSHLRDMEEIDALPPEQREEINECAQKIIDSQEQQEKFNRRKSRMTDAEFEHMERLQSDAKNGAKKLAEAEEYQRKIRNDLKRLDSEHEAYLFQEDDILTAIENSRKLIIAIGVALVLIIIFLLFLQWGLGLNVVYGFMVTILLAAVAITFLYIHMTNAAADLKVINKSISRLIMLQNQVKIRYVNNTNLIDYLCLKYGINTSKELTDMYDRYLKERKERAKVEESRKYLEENQKDLVYMLRHYRVKDPDIWVHQVEALLNHNEEVEIRHALNVRRQSLRKRMEYNRDIVAGNAKLEIEEMARQYPAYTQEILDMVSRYED